MCVCVGGWGGGGDRETETATETKAEMLVGLQGMSAAAGCARRVAVPSDGAARRPER